MLSSAEATARSQRQGTPPTADLAAAEDERSPSEEEDGGGREISSATPDPVAPPPAPAAEEVVAGWCEGGLASEPGEWWWCPCGVEEEKLSGWFPFAEEDFLCGGDGGRLGGGEEEWGGELLWEAADIDIWQLQHIHEIPRAT